MFQKKICSISILLFLFSQQLPAFAQTNISDSSYVVYDTSYTAEEMTGVNTNDSKAFRFSLNESPENTDTQTLHIDKKTWEHLTADKSFEYKKKKEAKNNRNLAWYNFITNVLLFLQSTFGQILLWSLIIIFIVILLYYIIKNRGYSIYERKNTKIVEDVIDVASDDFIPKNWDESIASAVSEGDYRLAIRLSFRYILTLLNDKNAIKYVPSKNNYQYAQELHDTPLKKPYMYLLRDYEYVWYGGFQITNQQFEQYQKVYEDLRKAL